MLTLDHPEIIAEIAAFPGGLMPIKPVGRLSLAIKASKEALLAIQLNGGFSIYVVPFQAGDGEGLSIITAIFDDPDEPLTIRTPLFGDEEPSVEIVGMLMAPELDIYFFDDLGREWMSYRCSLDDPGSCLKTNSAIHLATFDPANSIAILDYLGAWFGLRTAEDDDRAIKVSLGEELWPSDLAILDVRDGENEYLGSDGYAITTLTRDAQRPGYHQERDIVAALKRFLDPDQIILNPFKRGTDKEFVDIIVGTGKAVLLFQAKDSPNTARSLGRSIKRKQQTSESQLKGALKQLEGALRYATDSDPILLTTRRIDIDLHVAGRKVITIAIIKEIFPGQTPSIMEAMRTYAERAQTLVVLDYPGFCAFVHHFPEETRFVTELEEYSRVLKAVDQWITPQAFLIGRFLDKFPIDEGASDRGSRPN